MLYSEMPNTELQDINQLMSYTGVHWYVKDTCIVFSAKNIAKQAIYCAFYGFLCLGLPEMAKLLAV